MSKVQEAAERLRRVEANAETNDVCWISRVYDQMWGNPPEIDWHCDLRLVGKAYCAEHPADDDEPIDDWLESIGLHYDDDKKAWYAEDDIGRPVEVFYHRGIFVYGTLIANQPSNRGEFRRLCAALGVELQS